MYTRFTTNTVGTGLLALVGLALVALTLGCEQRAPSGPTQVPPTTPLSVIAIAPIMGSSVSYDYEFRWWQYTDGASSGTLTLDAPTTPGQYEFRYFPDDGFVVAVGSAPVTVTPR